MSIFDKLEEVILRYREIDVQLSDQSVFNDMKRYQGLTSERSKLAPIVEGYERFKEISRQLDDNKKLLSDSDEEIRELAREEIGPLTEQKEKIEQELQVLLLPKDPRNDRNVILEIRAGTGGDEAALFVYDLFRMYSKYAESRGWRIEIMSQSVTGLKGFKEVIALIEGQGAYSQLRYESGVHRVQRVPDTETQGRIHTSAVTVAVLPEADDVELDCNPADFKYDVYRSSGPGGQSVNTTDSAVRVTHIPTGLIVTCQDEKSQLKNKTKGLKILKSRLLDLAQQKQHDEISRERKSMVGSGDRSERIRTYNFPQGRVSDHRINLTLYKIEQIMLGDLQEIIDSLAAHYQAEALQASAESAAHA